MILYLLTISSQQKLQFIQKSDLDDVLKWLHQNIPAFHVYRSSYERSGKYSQLHFHGIISVGNYFHWKPYVQYGDADFMHLTFRVQWQRIRDVHGATSYVFKDTHNDSIKQDQIFQENVFKYNYFNIDTQEYKLLI